MNPTDQADETNSDSQEGLDKSTENGTIRENKTKINPRDELINSIQDEHWRREEENLRKKALEPGEPIENSDETPAPEVKVPAQTPAQAKGADAPDPLKDLIVVKDGKAMLKTKIDGTEQLIPLDKVQKDVQKYTAADVRLQHASAAIKEANARAEQVRQQEAALRTRAQSLPNQPDANDKATVANDAKKLVKALFSGTEDQAAEVLTEVLSKTRQAPVAAVNSEELVKQTAGVVLQTVDARAKAQDMGSAYKKFEKEFPDIVSNPRLFKQADSISDEVATEHPAWTPEEIYAEAGKRTREWVAELTGKPYQPAVDPQPDNARETVQVSRRTETKQNLRPMPTARVERVPLHEVEQPETASSVLAEIRKSRGQAA